MKTGEQDLVMEENNLNERAIMQMPHPCIASDWRYIDMDALESMHVLV